MSSHSETLPVQVLVWGGGSGGTAAALQAARAGAHTLLLTPGGWVGGMLSAAGVCAPDGNELSPWQTGLWGALLRQLARDEPDGLDQNWVSCFGFRPATAERILRRWLAAEALLRWWPWSRVLEVRRQDDRISDVLVERDSGSAHPSLVRVRPRIVIDGSDRGDLLPLAEAPFRLGWEPRELWQEPSAPTETQIAADPFFQRQPIQSPTWVVMGQWRDDGLPPEGGRADGKDEPELPAPFRGATKGFGLERMVTYGRLPGGLVMLNWPLHGNDWHRGLERAFRAGPAGSFPISAPPSGRGEVDSDRAALEEALAAEMRSHSLALLEALTEVSQGRLRAGAAFPTPSQAREGQLEGMESLALMPYWREGRRLVGQALVCEPDLLPRGGPGSIAPLAADAAGRPTAIAVGNYPNDHHYPGPDWPLAPRSCPWGGRWSGLPFTIPYGALVSAAVANLLAADKCFSVSHMANGATRLQPLILNLGQAAGQAAALCAKEGLDPADLPLRRLQLALIHDPSAPAGPMPLWDTPWHHPCWRRRQEAALHDPSLLDDSGEMEGAALETVRPPEERGEVRLRGQVVPGDGTYVLEGQGWSWPLITLEPAMHRWLRSLERSEPAELVGCLNPWGRWMRVSRRVE